MCDYVISITHSTQLNLKNLGVPLVNAMDPKKRGGMWRRAFREIIRGKLFD
jgi:hypothetical protein